MVAAPEDRDMAAASPPLAAQLCRAERAPDLYGAAENKLPAQIPGTPGAGTPSAVNVTAGVIAAPGDSLPRSTLARAARAPRKLFGKTMDEWIEEARRQHAAGHRGRPIAAAAYAAAAAKDEGAGADDCPFDPVTEENMAAEWRGYFRVVAEAPRREQQGTGARSQFQTVRRPRAVNTSSVAYSDLGGGFIVEGAEE